MPHAVIATGHPRTTDAAALVLRRGGNAFDAAVAAGFASAVAEPVLTSLGGGGFLLARTAAAEEILFDFFADTPGRGRRSVDLEPHFFPVTVRFGHSTQEFNIGLGSVAVPGNVAGYLHVQRRLGELPLAKVVSPAARLAREGVVLNRGQAHLLTLVAPILTASEAGRRIYAPNGRLLAERETLVNRDLSDFLAALAGGGTTLHAGDLAERIAADMSEGNGLLTKEDLARYRVIERTPLAIDYRDHRLLTNPPPSQGGSLIALSLDLLATRRIGGLPWGSAEHLSSLAAVMIEVDRLRSAGFTAPGTLGPHDRQAAIRRIRTFSRGTTHVSIADFDGNVASMTTSNGEGSGYVVPGTGIMLNNMMGEDDLHPGGFHAAPPGERVASMMSPTIVLHGDTVRLAAGSGGSKRIRTALLQVISNVIDFALPLERAVDAPRMHWDGELLQVEPGYSEGAVEALRLLLPVNPWRERDLYFGGVHAVATEGVAAADPRRHGGSLVLRSRGAPGGGR